jgi:hypothetical protein
MQERETFAISLICNKYSAAIVFEMSKQVWIFFPPGNVKLVSPKASVAKTGTVFR